MSKKTVEEAVETLQDDDAIDLALGMRLAMKVRHTDDDCRNGTVGQVVAARIRRLLIQFLK